MDDNMSAAEYAAKWNAEQMKQQLAKPSSLEKLNHFVRYSGRIYKVAASAIVDGKTIFTIRPTDSELRRKKAMAALYCKINTLTVPASKTTRIIAPRMIESLK